VTVYHWTTHENAKSILKEGLREGSFVCNDLSDWHGEVCLVIESLEMNVDEETWQAVTHRHIDPQEVRSMTLQEQYDLLLTEYKALLVLAKEGLKACSTCKGAGEMKWGLTTDAHPEIVACDNCGRPVLIKYLDDNKLGV
jgi:hypothetical protein